MRIEQIHCPHCGAVFSGSQIAIFGDHVNLCSGLTAHKPLEAANVTAKKRCPECAAAGRSAAWNCETCKGSGFQPEAATIKEQIADEAKRIVSGARRNAYGAPEDNFERIARFWTAYFQNTGRDLTITAGDVPPLMRLMKEARLCETPDHLDSHVDLVGYALTGAEVNKVHFPD